MCDYSLHTCATRSAVVGEDLVTSGFVGTATNGFGDPAEPEPRRTAVCLLPGTEIRFAEPVKAGYQNPKWLSWLTLRARKSVARFVQISTGNPAVHHDALEFPDGEVVLLTHLAPGQRATVLQLPVSRNAAAIERLASGEFDLPLVRGIPARRYWEPVDPEPAGA